MWRGASENRIRDACACVYIYRRVHAYADANACIINRRMGGYVFECMDGRMHTCGGHGVVGELGNYVDMDGNLCVHASLRCRFDEEICTYTYPHK